MKYASFISLIALFIATSACDRPEFGTQAKTGDVVDTDVEREAPDDESPGTGDEQEAEEPANAPENNFSDPIGVPSADRESADLNAILDGTAALGFDAYHAVAVERGPVAVGAYGLTRSAAVASLGAGGNAEVELQERVAPGLFGESLHDAFNALDYDLTSRDSATQIDLVTATWVPQEAAVEQTFVDDLSRYYGLTVRRAEFETRPDDARVTINNFYRDRTAGELTDVVPPRAVDATTEVLLTDGNRFRGTFEDAFDPEFTAQTDFTERGGTTRTVPMMLREGTVMGTTLDGFRAIELPFDGGFSLLLVLPEEGQFDEVEARFDPRLLDEIVSNLVPSYLVIGVPRVSFTDRVDLLEQAGRLGLDGAFSSDYSKVFPNARLSNVLQRTRLQFVEDGINADPVDLPPLDESDAMAADVPSFFLSRPFLWVVRDNETGTVLFLGRYE